MKEKDEKIENFTRVLEFMKKKSKTTEKNKLSEIQILTNVCPNCLNAVVQEMT